MNSLKKLFAFVLALILALTPIGCKKQTYIERVDYVFSSDMLLSISAYGVTHGDLDEMFEFANDFNALINPKIPSSSIAIFNSMAVGEIQVDEHVYNLVQLAKNAWEETSGAFDVTISPLSALWKVDNENLFAPHDHAMPTKEMLDEFSSTANGIDVKKAGEKYYIVKTHPSASLDLGGIAKGYLCDEIVKRLKDKNCISALVDLAGNLALLGNHINDKGQEEVWKVGVKNPNGAGYLCGINVSDSAVVTAGTYERYYEKDGVEYCHLINPFTKMPVGIIANGENYENTTNHVISCSIWGLSGAQCDALATATCVLGLESGKRLLSQKNANAIIVTADGKYTTVGNVSFMNGYEIEGLELV